MMQQFLEHNYTIVEFEDKADIYIINTCTVTNMSDRKSRQIIRRAKMHNPDGMIIACGCYVQVAKEELEKIPEIDLLLGINEKNKIVDYVEEYQKNKKQKEIEDVMKQQDFLDFGDVTYTEKTRAVIKVQDGCNRFCSYCIIPYARGRIRSRQIKSVVNEIQDIVKNGIKEVVITGIHIASYGKDFEEPIGLIDLLEEINKIEGLKRIRLGSIEPTLISEDFVRRLKKLDKICDHFHLSLQSGCDQTLQRMNRRYTTEEFRQVVKRLRRNYKEVALTTDIIVGFPGESSAEFQKTFQFLKEIEFYQMHIFKYSPRKGTKAAQMPDQIDGTIKEERSKLLIELSKINEVKFLEQAIGTEKEILFEEKEGNFIKGHTTNYRIVKLKYQPELENQIKKVFIQSRNGQELIARG